MTGDLLSSLGMAPPPADARVAVEGGHVTLHKLVLPRDEIIDAPRYCFFRAPRETPPGEFEVRREVVDEKESPNECWILVHLPAGTQVRPVDLAPSGVVAAVAEPRRFELHSLRQAMQVFHDLQNKVSHVQLVVLVGDLLLPNHLRKPAADWAVPATYREIFAQLGQENVLLLFESTCQNWAKRRVLEPAARYSDNAELRRKVYDEFGFGVFKTGVEAAPKSFYLIADWLLHGNRDFNAVIPLTKWRGKPSCAATLAAKLISLSRYGFTHHISFHDLENDRGIKQKCLEGAVIASYFERNLTTRSVIIVPSKGENPDPRVIEPNGLRKPRESRDYTELFCEASKRAPFLGFEILEIRRVHSCCDTDGTSVPVPDAAASGHSNAWGAAP